MTFVPAFARSAGVAIPAGFAAGTMTVSRFPAKSTSVPSARPPSTSAFGFDWSAERKASAGAPCSIWVRSVDEASVAMVRVTLGATVAYAVLTASSAPLSDEAP